MRWAEYDIDTDALALAMAYFDALGLDALEENRAGGLKKIQDCRAGNFTGSPDSAEVFSKARVKPEGPADGGSSDLDW
ncbi:MAG: hypothetical protein AB1427_03555 [Thermodesulfobacteriota bacterium]